MEDRRVLAATIVNIPGMSSPFNPPDTVGDVGPRHYVEMVNATQYQIWDKAGNSLAGPLALGDLWPIGDPCSSDTGDPIVVYDHLADRWVLTQFAFPSHMCFAVSQTPNPVAGTWFTYTFDTGVFPDYPKIGVWPDAYYMSSYESPDLGIYAFDRPAMLAGGPATFVKTTIPSLGAPGVRDTRILPADLDGVAPPVGTPNYFVRTVDSQQDPANPVDRIEVYAATPNFVAGTIAFPLVNTLTPSAFDIMTCNRNGQRVRDCIPQPNTVDTIDALSSRPMMQLRYRNFGQYQTMVFNQTIDVDSLIAVTDKEVAGLRWYELRKPAANWTIFQQGDYLPQPVGLNAENQILHRWMGSTAMDGAGNIAMGYSITNSDSYAPVFAGIRYAGRLATDALGTMRPEQLIANGVNFQGDLDAFVEPQRWGDYSTMSVDPLDDSTFWFVSHLAGVNGVGDRPTRIASFLLNPQPTINAGAASNAMTLRKNAADPTRIEVLIDGAVTNTYVLSDLTKLTINGGAGTNALTVDFVNGNPIPTGGLAFNGQGGAGDLLKVANGAFTNITDSFTNRTDGSIQLVQAGAISRTITYTGLAPVLLNVGSVGNLVFNLPVGPNLGVVVGNDLGGVVNTSEIRGATFENTSFTNPSTSLTINLGNLGDSITLLSLDPAFPVAATTTVNGGNGADTIVGNASANSLVGGGGNDILTGGSGNDTYFFDTDAALGTDTLNEAGGGVDTLNFSTTTTRSVSVDLSKAAVQVVNAGLSLILSNGTMFENVIGGSLADNLIGNTLANTFTGGGGNDTLRGGSGNDTYLFETGFAPETDTLDESGGGTDTLDFSATTTRSVVVDLSNPLAQVVYAGLTLVLGSGVTFENVTGGSLGDTLIGNTLANTLTGGPGNDSLAGGSGNDVYRFDTDLALGADTLNEAGGGVDTLDFSATTTRTVNVNLSVLGAQFVNAGLTLTLGSATTFEQVIGGRLGDTLTGNTLNNVLVGNAGNDTLQGGTGRDVLIGGFGADTLLGQDGDQLLIAGRTIYDANIAALQIILAEWSDPLKSYATRVTNLRAGVSGIKLQAAGIGATVLDDGGAVDILKGGPAQDWFFAAATDVITDRALGELVDMLP